MLYAIISQDVANSLEKRLAARPAHLERLQQLKHWQAPTQPSTVKIQGKPVLVDLW